MDYLDIENRFSFHPATAENNKGPIHDDIRTYLKDAAFHLDSVLPDGREKSLAITHLEEAMFWANAAVARSN